MHMRIVHSLSASLMQPSTMADDQLPTRQPESPATDESRARSIQAMMRQDETWTAKFRKASVVQHYNTTFNAIWSDHTGNYVACAGESCVTIHDPNTMKILQSFSDGGVVNAISGSRDGSLLVYGLSTGEIVLRDMSDQGRPLQTVPKREGKVFALWLSGDGCFLVICYDGVVETWHRQPRGIFPRSCDSQVSQEPWLIQQSWENKALSSRSLGQHALWGGNACFPISAELPEGSTLLAIGGPSLVVWAPRAPDTSKENHGTVLAEIAGDKTFTAVWMSPYSESYYNSLAPQFY